MYSPISPVGKKFLVISVLLWAIDVVAMAFAARVNIFQEFFFMADIFPLGLSIATFLVHVVLITADFMLMNSFANRPAFRLGVYCVLTIFWFSFNIFSTVRWQDVPMPCSAVPSEYPDMRAWCEDVQALKSFVWIYFVGVFLLGAYTLHYTLTQQRRGNRNIWKISLVRFDTRSTLAEKAPPVISTDYFASRPEYGTEHSFFDHQW